MKISRNFLRLRKKNNSSHSKEKNQKSMTQNKTQELKNGVRNEN
jgi:hypothetical protein